MKFLATLALAASSSFTLVAAQGASASDLPQCSLPCFVQYVPETGCSLTDYACQCTTAHQNQIKNQITSCVVSKCTNQQDQLKVLSVTQAICKQYGSSSSASGSGSMSASSSGSMMSGASSSAAMSGSMMGSASASASSTTKAAFTPTGPPTMEFTGAKAALDLDAKEVVRKWGGLVVGLGALMGWAL